jgi:hypothetical protein
MKRDDVLQACIVSLHASDPASHEWSQIAQMSQPTSPDNELSHGRLTLYPQESHPE